MSHIIGKVYDLTQDNFNKVIRELEKTQAALKVADEALEEISIEQKFYEKWKDYFSEVVRLNLTAKEALSEINKIRGEK